MTIDLFDGFTTSDQLFALGARGTVKGRHIVLIGVAIRAIVHAINQVTLEVIPLIAIRRQCGIDDFSHGFDCSISRFHVIAQHIGDDGVIHAQLIEQVGHLGAESRVHLFWCITVFITDHSHHDAVQVLRWEHVLIQALIHAFSNGDDGVQRRLTQPKQQGIGSSHINRVNGLSRIIGSVKLILDATKVHSCEIHFLILICSKWFPGKQPLRSLQGGGQT